jgi:O-antigen/teichoic acid export membrane protein
MTTDFNTHAEMKNKAGRGAMVLILRYGLNFIFNFAGSVVIIRKLGPEIWGQYALTYFILLTFIFLTYGIWGYIIQRPETPVKELKTCFSVQQFLSVAWALVVLLLISPWLVPRFGGEQVGILIASSVIGGYFFSWRWFLSAWQERKMDYVGVGASEVLDAVVFNLTAVAFTLAGHGVMGIALGNVLRGLLCALYLYFRARPPLGFGLDRTALKEVWKFGFPFTVYGALQGLQTQALTVVAGYFLGPAALGFVNLAYRFMEYPRVLVTLFIRISMSYYSRLTENRELFRKEANQGFQILFFVLGVAITGIAGLAWFWVPLVYGPEWKLSATIMMIIGVPFIINGCMSFFSTVLSTRGKVTQVASVQVIYNLVYLTAAFILIPRLKDMGLPVSEWIALPFGLALLYFVRKEIGNIPFLKYALQLLMFAVIITATGACFHYGYRLIGFLTFAFLLVILVVSQRQIASTVTKYAGQVPNLFK